MSAPLTQDEMTAALRLALAEVARLQKPRGPTFVPNSDLTQLLVLAQLAANVLGKRNRELAKRLEHRIDRVKAAHLYEVRLPQVEIFEGGRS